MADFWQTWMEAVRFTYEAQGVVPARLMLFATAVEAERMISEKLAAFSEAHNAAEQALAEGLAFTPRPNGPTRRCSAVCMPTTSANSK